MMATILKTEHWSIVSVGVTDKGQQPAGVRVAIHKPTVRAPPQSSFIPHTLNVTLPDRSCNHWRQYCAIIYWMCINYNRKASCVSLLSSFLIIIFVLIFVSIKNLNKHNHDVNGTGVWKFHIVGSRWFQKLVLFSVTHNSKCKRTLRAFLPEPCP